ncbi:MAG TPA: NAD(P)/FAD-dependent oxidoreductase [Alphaproteobacteria bacterium]
MTCHHPRILIVGAGAAGLMAGRDLARAGARVTILEARDRLGGRIFPLPRREFCYDAAGGAEFVHGDAPVTGALARDAGLSLSLVGGTRWSVENGLLIPDNAPPPHADELRQALAELQHDISVAEFLETRFAGPDYAELRQAIEQMVEGYDAADPRRASTFAIRDEWMAEGLHQQRRIDDGYGALIDFLAAECRQHGAAIHLGTPVRAIEAVDGRMVARMPGDSLEGAAVVLTVPLPLLTEIDLPPAARRKAALATANIGFGNVVKILLRFRTRWWADLDPGLEDMSFVFSDTVVPVWWTQVPAAHPVLTGWLGGPKTERVAHLTADGLIETGLAGLAEIFRRPLSVLKGDLVAARALNWGADPFARGAYSYATPTTARVKPVFRQPDGDNVFFSGEAFYVGRDMATVEAALASGQETARSILADQR